MGALYDLKVQSLDGNCLRCRATVHYRHGGGFPPSRTMALMLLADSISARTLKDRNSQIQAFYDEFYRALTSKSGVGSVDVHRFVNCVGVTDHLNCEELDQGEDEAKWLVNLPEATYTISVTDPRLLDHLEVGAEWDTTAFDADRKLTVDPQWRTSTVISLAKVIEAEQAFDQLPILADALQDTGCDSDNILNHFRDPNATHVRGCWALDLVLGKE